MSGPAPARGRMPLCLREFPSASDTKQGKHIWQRSKQTFARIAQAVRNHGQSNANLNGGSLSYKAECLTFARQFHA